jgi:serine/arginine repetitive matrix protein 2
MWLSLLKPLILRCHHAHGVAPKASFILCLCHKFCAQAIHSPTSTQTCSPPPLSGPSDLSSNAASRRTSRQNAPSSPFNLGPAHPLTLSPRPNSSRPSVASVGSSYHSDDSSHKKDRDFYLFSDRDTQYSPWHGVSSTEKTSPVTHEDSQDPSEAEDILKKYAGLTKSDFVAIQEKLVGVALAKAAAPDPRERVPSLHRWWPSTSQSNYFLNGHKNRACCLM